MSDSDKADPVSIYKPTALEPVAPRTYSFFGALWAHHFNVPFDPTKLVVRSRRLCEVYPLIGKPVGFYSGTLKEIDLDEFDLNTTYLLMSCKLAHLEDPVTALKFGYPNAAGSIYRSLQPFIDRALMLRLEYDALHPLTHS